MRRRPGRPVREPSRAADLRLPGERRSATRGGAELPLGVRAARHRGCAGDGAGPRGHVHRHERRRADDARLPQAARGPPRAGRRADRRHAQQRRPHRSRRDRVRGRPGQQLHREAHAELPGQHGHLRLRRAGAPISPRRPVPVPGSRHATAGGGRARRRLPERCRLVRHRHPQRVRACGRRRGAVPGQVRHGAAAVPAARVRAARACAARARAGARTSAWRWCAAPRADAGPPAASAWRRGSRRRQAHVRRRRRHARAGRPVAHLPVHRAADRAGLARARLLPRRANRLPRPASSHAQVPQDALGRPGPRPHVDGRRAPDAPRRVAGAHQARRASSALARATRRDEPGGPAPGVAEPRGPRPARVSGDPRRPSGPHRLQPARVRRGAVHPGSERSAGSLLQCAVCLRRWPWTVSTRVASARAATSRS